MEGIRDIEYEYARQREKAEKACEERVNALHASIPRLREIEEARRMEAFSLGERLLKAQNKEEERLNTARAIALLNEEEAALLRSHGLEEGCLKPSYACSVCADTGYIMAENGEARAVCRCMRQRLAQRRYASSFIHPHERFESFKTDIYPSEAQKKLSLRARDLCERFADAFPQNEPKSLLLMGNSGLGKSFLLNCIANRVYERGFEVYKLTAYNLIETVMQSVRGGSDAPDFVAPELLIVDDLGTEQMIQNITREQFFSIVNERQAANKATLFATNLSAEKLMEFYGERLFSRLVAPRQNAVLKLDGANLHIMLK